MLTEKDYCDYETCVALKELGFNGFSQGTYDINGKLTFRTAWLDNRRAEVLGLNIIAPHLCDAQKWLREEKGIFVYIDVPWKTDGGLGWSYFCCNKPMTEEDKEVCFASGGFYDSCEEALAEGLRKAVKILKEK